MIIDEKTKESAAGAPPEYSLAAAGPSRLSSFTETASPSQLSPSIDAAGPSRSGSFTDADARTMLDLPPPYEAVLGPLSLPFVLPQESVGLDYAFARGYNPTLAASGVPLADWLRFVDALNLATAGSASRHVFGVVGSALSATHPLLHLVGGLITASAQAGQRSSTRPPAERLLCVANAEFFAPRGLAARICTTSALKALVQRGERPSEKSAGKRAALSVGRLAKSTALHTGLGAHLLEVFSDKRQGHGLVRLDPATMSSSERRIAALAPHVLSASFDVPPPESPSSPNQAAQMSMKLQAWKAKREESRRADARRRLEEGDDRQLSELRRQSKLEEHQTKDLLWLVLMDAKLAELIHEFPMDVEPAGSSSKTLAQSSKS